MVSACSPELSWAAGQAVGPVARQLQRKVEHVDGLLVLPALEQAQPFIDCLLAALGPDGGVNE